MSGRDNKQRGPFDSKSIPNPKPIVERSNRPISSNPRTSTYVPPATRSTNAPTTSTGLSITSWRRNVEVSTTSADTHREQQLIDAQSMSSSESFRPMDRVKGVGHNFTPEEKIAKGFSWKYEGDINNPKNSSSGVPTDQNCAVFLTNIPNGVNEKILLDALGIHAPFGRVYATSVTSPAHGSIFHMACANITMFDRESAVALYDFVRSRRLVIAGRTIDVAWNKNRSPTQSKIPKSASRVVEILGPVEVVDYHRLSEFLQKNILFQTQDVTVIREDDKERLIKWTFCSYRAQAEVARQALRRQWPGLHIRWGIDSMSVAVNLVPTLPSNIPLPPKSSQSVGDLITFSDNGKEGGDEHEEDHQEDIYDLL